MAVPVAEDWQEGKTLGQCVSHMRMTNILTDVCFSFEDSEGRPQEKIEAHKLMLVGRSTVFETMFCGSFQEPGKAIRITDIEPETFNDMLQYMYTDNVDLNDDNVFPLAVASQKYLMSSLVHKCIKFIKSTISEDTIFKILDWSVLYDFKDLQMECLHYMKVHVDTIYWRKCEHLLPLSLTKESLEFLLDQEDEFLPEHRLFIYCNIWAGRICKERHLEDTRENRRLMLGPLLYKLRLASLNLSVFSTKVAPAKLLSDEEELSLFRYKTGIKVENLAFPVKRRLPEWAGYTSHNHPQAEITVRFRENMSLVGFQTNKTNIHSLSINKSEPVEIRRTRFAFIYALIPGIIVGPAGCRKIVISGGVNSPLHMTFIGKEGRVLEVDPKSTLKDPAKKSFWLKVYSAEPPPTERDDDDGPPPTKRQNTGQDRVSLTGLLVQEC